MSDTNAFRLLLLLSHRTYVCSRRISSTWKIWDANLKFIAILEIQEKHHGAATLNPTHHGVSRKRAFCDLATIGGADDLRFK